MDTASQKAISRKAHLAGKGGSLFKRCNTADDRFPTRPKGAYPSVQYGVIALTNETTITCGLRLVLNAWVSFVSIKPTLLEH